MSIFGAIESRIRNRLAEEMTILAGTIADDARRNASWSSTIPEAISVGTFQNDSNQIYIEILVDLNKAPSAAAYEYGSGIHKKDEPKEYEIPKEGSRTMLAFPKERWPGYVPPPEAPDIFHFAYVMHPGVEARPYLAPAIRNSRGSFRGIVLRAFKLGYIESVPRVTIVEVET